MKKIINNDKKIVSILVPIELAQMDELYHGAISATFENSRKKGVAILFSPSSQRASEISKCFIGQDIDLVKQIMPKYNYTLDQEIEALPGVVIIPEQDTSPKLLREELMDIIKSLETK